MQQKKMPITSENIAVVYNHVEKDSQTLTSSSATKASSTQEILKDTDELESMLSLTQTLSFDEGNDEQENDDNKSSAEDSYDDDNTYTTDDSYSVNSLESRSSKGRSKRISRRQKALVACGEGIGDASDRFFDSIVDTGRAISSILKRGSSTTTKNKYVISNRFFMSSEEQKQAKKEAIKRLEEERRERELRTSREEVGNVANLWRENRRFLA